MIPADDEQNFAFVGRAPNVRYQTQGLWHSMGLAYMPNSHDSQLVCWICGKLVPLEQSEIDEHGMPVHEECYAG